MSHHSSDPKHTKELQDAFHEVLKNSFGEFPDGKLNKHDEGAIAMAVGDEAGRVTLHFPKPVAWIGMTPDQAIALAQDLIGHARKAAKGTGYIITLLTT